MLVPEGIIMDKNLEELTGQLYKIKMAKDVINKQLAEIISQEDYLESLIITALQVEGIQKATTTLCTVSLKQTIYPQIKNWDELWDYMVKNNVSLLNKAINAVTWRGMIEQGLNVPGIKSYERITLSFRRK